MRPLAVLYLPLWRIFESNRDAGYVMHLNTLGFGMLRRGTSVNFELIVEELPAGGELIRGSAESHPPQQQRVIPAG